MSSEADVGITQYANSLPGFTGILKHRYTDFKVNEIDPQGVVVRLTSLEWEAKADEQQAAAPGASSAGQDQGAAPAAAAADVDAAVACFAQLAGDAQLCAVRQFLEQALAWQSASAPQQGQAGGGGRGERPRAPSPLTLDPIADKEARKAVHQLFKSLPGFPLLETTTVAHPAVKGEGEQQQQLQKQQQQQAAASEPPSGSNQGAVAAAPSISAQQPLEQEQGSLVESDALLAVVAAAGEEKQESEAGRHKAGKAATARAALAPARGCEGLQCIQIRVVHKGRGGGGRGGRGGAGGGGWGNKRKWGGDGWAGGEQDFVKFVLYKENMDSQVALSTLARLMHVQNKVFGVAGTKDKRGVTVQAVTGYRLDPARLAALNLRLRGMRVGGFQFCDKGLWLGDLRGNRFEVILRNIEAESPAAVEAAAVGLRGSGFINYFGLQRFGSGAVPTHHIGRTLLRGEWREAVRLVLTPREDARDEVLAACRAFLDKGDVAKALQGMPRHLVAECAILQGLQQYGESQSLQSLSRIPRNLRTMYLHAYQSYLWNAAASHRVTTYPRDRPVAGDLVLIPAACAAAANPDAAGVSSGKAKRQAVAASLGADEEEGHAQLAAAAEPTAAVAAEGPGEEGGEEEGVPAAGGEKEEGSVHVVTEEEAAGGVYRMEDVVLPLPGWQIQYPQHATAQVYTEVAEKDGVSLTQAPHGTREFMMTQLPGAYRRVIHRPADLQYEVLKYDDPNQELATTDLMELEGKATQQQQEGDGSGRYLGLRLSFALPTSCYATMLIRELTKMPTTTAFHKALQH